MASELDKDMENLTLRSDGEGSGSTTPAVGTGGARPKVEQVENAQRSAASTESNTGQDDEGRGSNEDVETGGTPTEPNPPVAENEKAEKNLILSLNVRSSYAWKKKCGLEELLEQPRFRGRVAVVALQEVGNKGAENPNEKDADGQWSLEGFQDCRHMWTRGGYSSGGVAIFLADGIDAVADFNPKLRCKEGEFEAVAVKLKKSGIVIVNAYCPKGDKPASKKNNYLLRL